MATKYWIGGSAAVAQVHTGSIDSVDGTPANNTFTVTIGGVAISQAGDTDVATTAAALVVLLNASTHPYFSTITWTNPSAGNIVGTADTAGVPFIAALTETGAGTGAVTDFAETTASAGASDWSTADNWSDGSIPANSDNVIIANSTQNICYGLDQSAVDLTSIKIEQTYTGKIGLPYSAFSTSVNGGGEESYIEYRQSYLQIGYDVGDIGEFSGTGNPAGSQRIKLHNDKAGTSVTTIHKTANAASETGFSAVRLLASNAGADYYIREAKGGVSFALSEPNETATIGDVYVTANDASSKVFIGSGTTLTNYTQSGGTNYVNAAATVTLIEVNGGTLTTEGDYTVTTLELNDGTVYCNHIKTSANAITTGNINGGTLDSSNNSEARTWATINPDGGDIVIDDAVVTITTLDQPSGLKTLSVS